MYPGSDAVPVKPITLCDLADVNGGGSCDAPYACIGEDIDDTAAQNMHHDPNRVVFTVDELRALFGACVYARDRLLLGILHSTGMRASGVLSIKLASMCAITTNVHSVSGSITASVLPHRYGVAIEKGSKLHHFPITRTVAGDLIQFVQGERSRDCCDSPYLFPSHTNPVGHMHYRTLARWFKQLCLSAGMTDSRCHLHTMRTTLCQSLADAGIPLDVLAKFVGHTSVATTHRYYLNLEYAQLAKKVEHALLLPTSGAAMVHPTTMMTRQCDRQQQQHQQCAASAVHM
jgi:integrase